MEIFPIIAVTGSVILSQNSETHFTRSLWLGNAAAMFMIFIVIVARKFGGG